MVKKISTFQATIQLACGLEIMKAGLSDATDGIAKAHGEVIGTLVAALGSVIAVAAAGDKAVLEKLFYCVDMQVRDAAAKTNKTAAESGLFNVA